MAKQVNGTMKDEKQPGDWPGIEARLRDDARRDAPEFSPFLHQRIMTAVRAEAERQARPRLGLAKVWRWVFAGGMAAVALALALALKPVPQQVAVDSPQKVSEWIVLAANSDDQMASLISNRLLNDMVTNPYQQQLDSLSNELQNALDFTLRLMPIEVALR